MYPTSILDVYKAFCHLDNYAVYGHMGPPLTVKSLCRSVLGFGVLRVALSLNPEQCCFVEAIPGLSLDPTSILGVYKVFYHLMCRV